MCVCVCVCVCACVCACVFGETGSQTLQLKLTNPNPNRTCIPLLNGLCVGRLSHRYLNESISVSPPSSWHNGQPDGGVPLTIGRITDHPLDQRPLVFSEQLLLWSTAGQERTSCPKQPSAGVRLLSSRAHSNPLTSSETTCGWYAFVG